MSTVEKIMKKQLKTVGPGVSVVSAAKKMKAAKVGSLLVKKGKKRWFLIADGILYWFTKELVMLSSFFLPLSIPSLSDHHFSIFRTSFSIKYSLHFCPFFHHFFSALFSILKSPSYFLSTLHFFLYLQISNSLHSICLLHSFSFSNSFV